MPPRRIPASSGSSGGAAAPPGGKPSARGSSHPKPPGALEMALDTYLDASTHGRLAALAALAEAAEAAPTELLTPEHIQRLTVMLRDPLGWRAGFALLHLSLGSTDRQKQFGGECLLLAVVVSV